MVQRKQDTEAEGARFEDVPQAGLVLIPPSSEVYDPFLDDIRARCTRSACQYRGYPGVLSEEEAADAFSGERDTSAIFLNKNEKAIAFMQVLWRYELLDDRQYVAACAWSGGDTLLLPFGLTPQAKALWSYWSAILPGSKRYLTRNSGKMVGDNTDVRPPAAHEIWKGGFLTGSGGGGINLSHPPRAMTISIEGAFFVDGAFAGRNRTKLFEKVTSEAEAYVRIAKIARDGKNAVSPRAILDQIERVTGKAGKSTSLPLLPPRNIAASAFERQALGEIAHQISAMRMSQSEEEIVRTLAEWTNVSLPNFRRWPLTGA
jgi:hypothetical protein